MTSLDIEKSLESQLEELLSEDISSVINREQITFDKLVAPFNNSLVLVGAGKLGRQVLARLRQDGIEPLVFTDNNPRLWNQVVEGLMVLSPQDAAQKFGQKAAFVVTIWSTGHRFTETRQQFQELNCLKVVSALSFRWKYPEIFLPFFWADLPHKIYEQADDIRRGFSLWTDDFSRREYLAQLRRNALGDFDCLSPPIAQEQYFPNDLFSLLTDEVFVDCGAFDGDTSRSFIKRQGSSFDKFIALEPDPLSFQKLQSYVLTLAADVRDKVTLLQLGVGAKKETVRFDGTGTSASAVSASGTIEVECQPLDEILSDCVPSYIKMDIEGAEPDALVGASQVIGQYAPILAVCVYHQQNHLWQVPLLVQSLYPDYRFFLRPHAEDGWELVCYAVPVNRLKS
jgi:FkbM family methyltransferase